MKPCLRFHGLGPLPAVAWDAGTHATLNTVTEVLKRHKLYKGPGSMSTVVRVKDDWVAHLLHECAIEAERWAIRRWGAPGAARKVRWSAEFTGMLLERMLRKNHQALEAVITLNGPPGLRKVMWTEVQVTEKLILKTFNLPPRKR